VTADFATASLAALGLLTVLAAAILGGAALLRAIGRLRHDPFQDLYGRHYGYRAPLTPDPLLPLALAIEIHVFKPLFRRHPRVVWQNTSLAAHGFATGRAFRHGEGVTLLLDDGANLPFVVVLMDLTAVGLPDVKVGLQSGLLQTHGHPYAAPLLLSRRPLDQRTVAEALKRFPALGVTMEAARAAADEVLAGTPPALTVLVGALAEAKGAPQG
jgi:hypothetical protein